LILKSQKPINDQYPKEIKTLGDHLKKRRLDLELLQKEVAERLGVSVCSIRNWEKQRNSPEIWFIAPIIEFLGYDPFPEPKTLPEKLKTCRMRMGMTQEELARKLGIDPGTLRSREMGRHKPTQQSQEIIQEFLERRSLRWN
jgi:transcriptional regulator with XRE-family HTH domain